MSRSLSGDGLRFILAGGLNTALTSGIYFALLLLVSPEIAYAMSWAAGLIFVVLVYPDRVFLGGRKTRCDRLMLGSITIGVFVFGLVMLRTFNALGIAPQLSFMMTLFCTTLSNFVLGRILLRRPSSADDSMSSALPD